MKIRLDQNKKAYLQVLHPPRLFLPLPPVLGGAIGRLPGETLLFAFIFQSRNLLDLRQDRSLLSSFNVNRLDTDTARRYYMAFGRTGASKAVISPWTAQQCLTVCDNSILFTNGSVFPTPSSGIHRHVRCDLSGLRRIAL